VIDRYQQWIFLFVGWALKAPPGTVARERIGDFWAALSEHPGAGKARICEAMDALGFFFGHLRREAGLLFLPDGRDEADVETPPQAPDGNESGFSRPNPSLRIRGARAEGPPSTEALSSRQLSRYLPEGTLPDEPDIRSNIPTRDISRREGPTDGSRETLQNVPTPREEQEAAAPSGTLFNPEGLDQRAEASGPSGAPTESNASAPAPEPVDQQRESRPEDRADEHSDRSDPADDPSTDPDRVPVQIPRSVADRLRAAAQQLGLPPSVFAARAIELVCDDAGIERVETPDAEAPLERYQTQIDLLQLQEEHAEASGSQRAGPDDEEQHPERSDGPAKRQEESVDRETGVDGRASSAGEGDGDATGAERRTASGEDRPENEGDAPQRESPRPLGGWEDAAPSGGDGSRGSAPPSSP
jgi:hypothetical protein